MNVRNPTKTEFDLENLHIVSKYNILIHCVYDPDNQFDAEFEFLQDPVLDANTLVILWHPVEAGVWNPEWMAKLDHIVEKMPFRLVYLTGCSHLLNIKEFINYKFDIKFFPVFDIRAQDIFRRKGGAQPVAVDKTNKFMFINSKDTPNRRFTLGNLIKHSLLDQGVVSYQCVGGLFNIQFDQQHGFTQDQLINVDEYFDLAATAIPIKLDDSTFANHLPRELFLNSYLNIVGESVFINIPNSFNMSFVTEKTFGSMINNQMFIVVGQAGSLDLIKSLGYKTFDNIIDESYDSIINNGDRLIAVNKEITRFVSRPIEDIKHDYLQVLDRIEHNRDLLSKQNLQSRLQNFINEHYA
jgi:hypothetical protein